MKEMDLNPVSNRWVDQISKNFKDEVGIDVNDVPVCVFSVPKSVSRFKPEAYVPQAIALGPYHHFERHLYQMERYKVAVVKAFLDPDQVHSFWPLVIERLKKIEPMIRACYHKYLDLDVDTLAWIVAIDGLFLLDLFTNFGEIKRFIPKKLMNYDVLYRDIMGLENQMPLVILKEIRKIVRVSSLDQYSDTELLSMLIGFCEVHSPLKFTRDLDCYSVRTTSYLHLLDLMYCLIVNNQSPKQAFEVESRHDERVNEAQEITEKNHAIGHMEEIIEMGQKFSNMRRIGKAINVIVSIPWEKISKMLGLRLGKKLNEDKDILKEHPQVKEIEIPSVSSLSKYGGINFKRTNGGIRDVKFEENEATLYLPVITLETYSEVVLRNLVAYESATTNSTMELAQYIDLMCGIIDTEDDVSLLIEKGIIRGSLTKKGIIDIFNGMNKSSEGSRGNETVEKLNGFYNSRYAIKTWRFVKKRMRGSRKVLMVVLTILACLFMMVYSFCEVYGCPKLFNKIT